MNDKPLEPVTVIGLGLMGCALANAFLNAGHPTTVWNRTTAKADQLVADGAELAPSVGAAVRAGSLTVVCVTDYQAVRDLLDVDDVELDGTVLVNLTSGDSAEARETADWVEARGAHYMDGAIMAVPAAIGTPEAVILYSGPKPYFERYEAALAAVGTATYLGADHGTASVYDAAGLVMMWSILNAWLQGVALVETVDVDAATFTPFVQQAARGTSRMAQRLCPAGRQRVLPRRRCGSGDSCPEHAAPCGGERGGGCRCRVAQTVPGHG
ncbi:NAD(P)-binding domain-containing protein [Nocardia sp. NPDC051990]|uniref:NAD(P)-dependent oxidoreductase n=1 Tax=Nocardia sp. NPDC051990 TaxID=3155285 RepID=UPI00343CCC5B